VADEVNSACHVFGSKIHRKNECVFILNFYSWVQDNVNQMDERETIYVF
jgi:hypothetical protein